MAASVLPHGEIVFIREILAAPAKYSSVTVRITGRVVSYHPENSYLICEDVVSQNESTGTKLRVDTRLIEPFHIQSGDLALFIGEIHSQTPVGGQQQLQLRARVHSNVNGLNMNLYAKALELRRRFLAGDL